MSFLMTQMTYVIFDKKKMKMNEKKNAYSMFLTYALVKALDVCLPVGANMCAYKGTLYLYIAFISIHTVHMYV